jgi:alpha-beta hydrolase superfamily lysophospholipase
MDEGGMFVRLADRLAETGFSVLRFSFRGHGKSGGAAGQTRWFGLIEYVGGRVTA